jgi:hypothetical protein
LLKNKTGVLPDTKQAINLDQIRKMQFFINVAMFCQGMPGGSRFKDGVANDCLEGLKNPLKDKRGTSKPNSLERIETGSIWCASFTLICNCLSLQHFILLQL